MSLLIRRGLDLEVEKQQHGAVAEPALGRARACCEQLSTAVSKHGIDEQV